jgi:hypothetical protein
MTHLGPLLARSLVRNFAGHAARSELDKLCEPLKKLVVTRVEAQGWLQLALADEGHGGGGGGGGGVFPAGAAERVGEGERGAWVRRVVG